MKLGPLSTATDPFCELGTLTLAVTVLTFRSVGHFQRDGVNASIAIKQPIPRWTTHRSVRNDTFPDWTASKITDSVINDPFGSG